MRNLLYPRQKAAYLTEAQLRELKKQNIVIERDFNFGMKRPEDELAPPGTEDSRLDAYTQLLSVAIFRHTISTEPCANSKPARENHRGFGRDLAGCAYFLPKPNNTTSARASSPAASSSVSAAIYEHCCYGCGSDSGLACS